MSARRAWLSFQLSRMGGFWNQFRRSKRAVIGIAILVGYAVFGLAAPLLTPHNPIEDQNLAGQRAYPSWWRTLAGGKFLSQNLVLVQNPDLTKATDLQDHGFQVAAPSTVSLSFDSAIAPPLGTLPSGSEQLSYSRAPGPATPVNISITRDFSWPYTGPPQRFKALMSVLPAEISGLSSVDVTVFIAQGSARFIILKQTLTTESVGNSHTYETGEPVITGTAPGYGTILSDDSRIRYVDSDNNGAWDSGETVVYDADGNGLYEGGDQVIAGTAPSIGLALKNDLRVKYFDSNSSKAWELGESVLYDSIKWIFPIFDLDSFAPTMRQNYFGGSIKDPATQIFHEAGPYTYGIQITIQDTNPSNAASMKIYFDELNLTMLGTSFGLLGTDEFGRDIFSQLAWGTRISLLVGLTASVLAVVLGLLVGLIAGYLGRYVDETLMRFSDLILVLPGLPLLIVLAALLGSSIQNIILVLGLLGWPGFARVVRSQVLTIKERPFIEASKAAGSGTAHIISRHIVPNVMSLTYVSLALAVPTAIVAEAALAFLGLWDPSVMSWGRMLNAVQSNGATTSWWWILPPGFSIAALSLSFVLLGYALDDVLNPRLRRRR